MKFTYTSNGQEHTLTLEKHGDGYRARIGEQTFEVELLGAENGAVHFRLDGVPHRARVALDGPQKRWVAVAGRTYTLEKSGPARRRGHDGGAGGGQVAAPMPGQIRAVLVAEGDEVVQGQPLLLMEAMKMEIRIAAPRAGIVAVLRAAVGATVNKDDVLVEIA
ncbi:MAG: biotin/lipoyl-binding protein [Anaerolineae bacterium]|nr:MAG: biotin/lipoyl-binding protein [Anaerolineae bacterium]